MGRRFQSGDSITFPVPSALNGSDGGPLTILAVCKVNTSAYQAVVYTRSSGAHGWWMEVDTSGGLHANYGTGTTPRNVGTLGTGADLIITGRKDAGGSVHPFGRSFTGASFATDGGDVDSGFTLVDGTAIDTSYGVQFGRWGNSGTDYSGDLVLYFVAIWTSLLSGATLAGLTKTAAGIKAGSPTYWAQFDGSNVTDSAGGTPTITGTTVVSDPSGFFASGFSAALPVAIETASALTFGRSKVGTLPTATEIASALAPARSKAGPLPAAVETSSGVAPAGAKAGALPVAAETNTAVQLATAGLVQALPTAVETSSAIALSGSKAGALPVATETDTALMLLGGTTEGDNMRLADIMDQIAERLRLAPSLAGRTFAYPQPSVKPPMAIVSYPTSYVYDQIYGRGMDRIKGEVVIVVGRPIDRTTRDLITKYVDGSGAESVKALVDGNAGSYTSCDTVRVESVAIDVWSIGAIDYLAAVFSIDIAGRGAA